MIPWFAGGHTDPWNHVEAAMALTVGGALDEADRAYEWLRATQRADGSWYTYYLADGEVEDRRLDTNVCAYVATGVWHYFLATRDSGFLEDLWPSVERAIDFVLSWQRPGGDSRGPSTRTGHRGAMGCSPAPPRRTSASAAPSRAPSSSAGSAPTGSWRPDACATP